MFVKFISLSQEDKYTNEEKLKYRKSIFENKSMTKKYFFPLGKLKR